MSRAPAKTSSSPTKIPNKFWEFADLGFDTGKKLWFVQFVNETNQNVGSYFAKTVTLNNGRAIQYQWKDSQGRAFWHVRERFFADEIESFSIDPAGSITINFKGEETGEELQAPKEFAYLQYAFHLSNKDDEKAPTGFVDFFNARGDLIQTLNNRWIVIEGAVRRTVGEFPKIRLRIDKKDVSGITVTRSVVVITGNPPQK